MGIGALRRHRDRHQISPEVAAEPSTEVKQDSITPEKLAELRENPAFEAAYQEELKLAAEKEAAEKAAADQAAAEKEAAHQEELRLAEEAEQAKQ